jgi:flagellar P-ring protein precursor FlgI
MMKKIILTGLLLGITGNVNAARLKDLASVEGVRTHALLGYGLVVGLQGTGDDIRVPFTKQSIASLLKRMGVVVPASALRVRNVAAVLITAKLPAYARVGQKIDVTVASMGNAKSLTGGMLILTPLKGPDGKIYAAAQGPITVGGFNFSKNGTSVQKNHAAAGTVSNGGTIERTLLNTTLANSTLRFILSQPDFTTAFRIAKQIDKVMGSKVAQALDAASVEVTIPETFKSRVVELLATLEAVEVEPDGRSKVVIN